MDYGLRLHSAETLLSINAAQILEYLGLGLTDSLRQELWQTILAKAYNIVPKIQNWEPQYFDHMNPLSGYIVFLSATVLSIELALHPQSPDQAIRSDIALLSVFLRQLGQYWPIGTFGPCELLEVNADQPRVGHRLAGEPPRAGGCLSGLLTFCGPASTFALQRNTTSCTTYRDAMRSLWSLTAFHGPTDIRNMPLAQEAHRDLSSEENDTLPSDLSFDMDGMSWPYEQASTSLDGDMLDFGEVPHF